MFNHFRDHLQSMAKLRTLLSEKDKIRRGRRIFLNMNIHIFAWIVELFGNLSFLLMVFSPQENWTTRGVQLVVGFFYFIAIPSTYLMSSSDFKRIVLHNWIYRAFIDRFFPHINQIVPLNRDDNENMGADVNENKF